LDKQWKGKILLDRRGWMFSHLASTALNDEWMTDYLNKLRMQKPVFCKGIPTLGTMIYAGEADIGMPFYTYMLNDLNAKKAPIDWFRLSPMVYTTRSLYVPRGAPHPNAARLWTGWNCSPEGVRTWEEVSGEGIALPGSGTKIRKLLDQEGIEIVTLKTAKDLARSEELEAKYASILAGR
jgi:iron(III) transport system substrate-binding protein